MKRVARSISSFSHDSDGSVAILFSLLLIIMVGSVGFAVDYSRWLSKRTDLGGAADAGSLAGARELALAMIEHDDNNAVGRAEAIAKRYVQTNRGEGAAVNVLVNASGSYSVKVELQEYGEQHFSNAFVSEEPNIGAISVAMADRAADACVVALSANASPGIEYNLSGEVVATDCSIWSNSTMASSTLGKGSGSVTADTNCAVGGANVGGGLSVSPAARSNCLPVKDPLASWSPPPTPWACKASNLVLDKPGTYTLRPGKYCGGITIKGQARVTFEPGTYFIKGGALLVEGGGSIYGDDVSFIFTGGAFVNLGGAAVVDLSAPTSGDTAGILLASGRDEPANASLLRGGTQFSLEGYIYLPTHNLRYSGGPAGSHPAGYTSVIASTVRFDGSSEVVFRTKGEGSYFHAPAFRRVYLTN